MSRALLIRIKRAPPATRYHGVMMNAGVDANVADCEPDAETRCTDAGADIPSDPRALMDHILTRFHAVHRCELPELCTLARRVEKTHASHPQCPQGLAALLDAMLSELEDHMVREERVLFPTLLAGGGGCAPFAMRKMRLEHDVHQTHLAELEALTRGFTPPPDACGSWRALYQGCKKLSDDLRRHIAIENEVLFPLYEKTP